MKQQLYRLFSVVLLVISFLAILNMVVYAKDEDNISLLKTSDDSYIIYVEKELDTDFLFAFSDSIEVDEDDLTFLASGLDSNELNVAYITKDIAESIINEKTYMFLKNNKEELKMYEIDLKQAVTEEEIEFINTTTKRISVDTTGNEYTNQEINGVKITHSQGKIKITEQGNNFSYYMQKVSTDQTANFINLANKIIDSNETTNYEKVTLARNFIDSYNSMFNSISNWTDVNDDKEIIQPQESKKGDIYLVWIKDNTNNVNDVQILICDDEQNIVVEPEKTVKVYETTKLPITYDTIITLIIALIVLVVAIVALVIIKKKLNSKKD